MCFAFQDTFLISQRVNVSKFQGSKASKCSNFRTFITVNISNVQTFKVMSYSSFQTFKASNAQSFKVRRHCQTSNRQPFKRSLKKKAQTSMFKLSSLQSLKAHHQVVKQGGVPLNLVHHFKILSEKMVNQFYRSQTNLIHII